MMGIRYCCCLPLAALAVICSVLPHRAAHAQMSNILAPTPTENVKKDEPVTFSADQVEYDKDKALVTATGHVEAWQNGHVLRADRITFDRNTGVAAATGNVVLLEPDGEVMFADYAEMRNNMKDGILKDVRALLQQNGRMAANGAQRTGGQINEMSKVVYSVCNACATDPSRPLLWQIRAKSAVQDLEHKKIEYYDATLDMFGIPVAYVPYFWHADPSVKRMSGILPPVLGNSSNIGAFYGQPYYWVIDDQSDATFTPMITSRAGPQMDAEYRRRFNSGYLVLNGSAGYINDSLQGSVASTGQFSWDDTWRYGFVVNRASSADYVRDFHLTSGLSGDPNILASQFYLEGFGDGAYARLDSRIYQGLNDTITDSQLPVVLPRYEYSYFGRQDSLGGRLSVDAGAFNVIRTDGTNTRRASLALNWERPFVGRLGDLWKVTLHGDAIGYNASQLENQPTFGNTDNMSAARALPQVALDFRWPFARNSGAWGTQLIEPIAQVIVAPQTGDSQNWRYPNEDSLDFEFTDANLFGFNRFPGVDRLEGGTRANVALHTAWYLGGTAFDGIIGQSYRTNKDYLFPAASGLQNQVSDIVARATFAPSPWLDVTYRTRLNPGPISTHFADAVASAGVPLFRVNAGYIYTNYDPYYYYQQAPPPPASSGYYVPRNEITLGASSQWGHYRLSANVRRDLATNQMVYVGGDAVYEDECFIFDLRFYRRYTSYNGDNGATAVLFLLTFKTIGQFGYRAL
ncbi:LPS-assembly protein LptD [Rhodopila sp.]|jgi:LPS-assembly protein|uniref:LPS-assembly protein LptD n=1 Tax=Rhodopila sp. TaxID=2480087 RepID=UPI002C4567DA|nr:LPS assembly protein LptD [Rhodopila sp.]HVZ08584.1 LPS assembly protein LptD [Rhodopila sp.]